MISLRPRRSASGNTNLSFFGLTVAATLTALLVSVTVTGGASAYYTAPGLGSGSAALGTLLPPTDVLVPATSAGTVSLRWTASVGTPAPTGYYATRTETATDATTPACDTSPATTVVTASCDDLLVLTGDYTYTVTAVYSGWTAASAPSGRVTVSNPAQLAFETQPSDATSGTVFAAQPSVKIQNAEEETVPTSTSPVTLGITGSPAGATLTCAENPLPAVSGIATFAGCRIDKAGSYTLTATANGLTAATSDSITIAAGAATQLSFTTQPGAATGGIAFGTQPVVTVQDAFGNTVTTSTASVTASSTGTSLTCSPNSNTTVATAGVATFTGCTIATAGNYNLTATAGQLTTTSSAFAVLVGAPAKLAFTTQPPTSSTAGAALSATVTVQDAGGNTVTASTNLVTLGITNGSSTCGSSTPTAGMVAFTNCKVDKAGAYSLSATSAGLAPAESTMVTITAGAATALVFSTRPANATGGLPFGTQPVVTVRDGFGNPVNAAVTLSVPVGGALTCAANPVLAGAGNSALGVAAFAGCRIDTASATPYILTATSGSITTTSSLTVTVGSPSRLFFSQPTTATSATGGTEFAAESQPLVIVQDAGGNTVTNSSATVTLGITGSPANAALTCTANSVTAVAGVAAFSRCKIDKAATYTLIASGNGLKSATSSVITINVGAVTKLTITGVPATGSTNTSFAAIVTARDAGENHVDTQVTLDITGGSPAGRLGCSPGLTGTTVSGVVTFTCTIDKSSKSAYGLRATSSNGVTSSVAITIN